MMQARSRLCAGKLGLMLALLFFGPLMGYVWPAQGAPSVSPAELASQSDDPNPPTVPVKLVFIHHSTGEGWLADDQGQLGLTLRDNNYFVSDTNYGWGPDGIGDTTDIGHWWSWFAGPERERYTVALYREYEQHCSYARLAQDPGGENQIVVFKSCFPNSQVEGSPTDPPTTGDNPLRGQSEPLTVGNAKGIYNDLLPYFASRQDKLFIVITAPPLVAGQTDAEHAANARALNDWLVNDWLDAYPYHNVAVFDFFNVLTTNGGNTNSNDAGRATGNHHRWRNGTIEHVHPVASDYSAYASSSDDSHPTAAGGRKASVEFAPLLNIFYHRWLGSQGTPGTPTRTATATHVPTRTNTPGSPPPPTVTWTPTRTDTPVMPGGTPTRVWLPILLKGMRSWSSPTPTSTSQPPATPTATTAAQAETSVIQRGTHGEVADAYVWESEPTYTGNWETLYTGCVGWGRKKTLVRFDLTSLDPGAQVQSATFSIWQKGATQRRTVNVHRVLADWEEDSVNWTSLAGAYAASPLGSFPSDEEGWRRVDVTSLVQSWLDGSLPNHGLLLDDPSAGTDESEEYYASEYEEVGLRPKLEILVTR